MRFCSQGLLSARRGAALQREHTGGSWKPGGFGTAQPAVKAGPDPSVVPPKTSKTHTPKSGTPRAHKTHLRAGLRASVALAGEINGSRDLELLKWRQKISGSPLPAQPQRLCEQEQGLILCSREHAEAGSSSGLFSGCCCCPEPAPSPHPVPPNVSRLHFEGISAGMA